MEIQRGARLIETARRASMTEVVVSVTVLTLEEENAKKKRKRVERERFKERRNQ
jgi:hypothetical protein